MSKERALFFSSFIKIVTNALEGQKLKFFLI